MTPPDLAGQQFSGDRSPRNDDFSQMPDLGPGGLWVEAQYPKPLVAFSMHGVLTIFTDDEIVRSMHDSASSSHSNCCRVLS
jgi:hypothetical protein